MANSISAVILAGGKARRMEGRDKGLQPWQGVPLVQHCLQRLQPQVAEIAINANRHLTDYENFGVPVFSDELADFQGPLSGMLTALKRASSDFVLFVPCDCPRLPLNLLEKLKSVVENQSVLLAYAQDSEREHPTFCLMSPQLTEKLAAYLARGERKIRCFMAENQAAVVDFCGQEDDFRNMNTLADLKE